MRALPRRFRCIEPAIIQWNLQLVRCSAHHTHPTYSISSLNIVCDEYSTTKSGTNNGTSTILVKHLDATELSIWDMQEIFIYCCLSTNDIQATADEVVDLVAGILSKTQFLPSLISVKISKPTAGTKLGINIINPEEGIFRIPSIVKGLLG
jgi:hypothetical protein